MFIRLREKLKRTYPVSLRIITRFLFDVVGEKCIKDQLGNFAFDRESKHSVGKDH